jgi:eukaryotic-like serine/threonine-protein kinase
MPIGPGVRPGPYEIVAAAGSGGMGEVYRARDTRLDRIVAIKVLPPHLEADHQLRDRFDREARAISSLSHPHICALFDVGRDGETGFLVLEFLDGETLADRLTSGPLPLAQALQYAIQICDALDKAHRAGIVHRDLKPANVMVTKSGTKLLDFGLSKAATPVMGTSPLSMLPTTPPGLTAHGTILGTFQYMAPEQIEGSEANTRTDIFAFGAVLFEMLAGRPPFEGKTRASLLGAILKDTPPSLSSLHLDVPPSLSRLVATCLEKDPDNRWQSARDLQRELQWIAARPSEPAAAASDHTAALGRTMWIGAIALLVLLTVLGAIAARHLRETPPPLEPITFRIAAADDIVLGGPTGGGTGQAAQVAVSPDGRHVLFVAATQNVFRLWIRSLGAGAPRVLGGTDGAAFPFWSPDSRFIAFFADGKLKKIALSGGPPVTLCDAAGGGRGGSWSRDNALVFAPAALGPLLRVSASGGAPSAATVLDTTYGDTNHRYPQFLPDGRRFLFTAVTGTSGAAPRPSLIKIASLDSSDVATVVAAESSSAYSLGHLLFIRDGTLMAQPFDPNAGRLAGDATPIAEQVGTEPSRYASFAVSPTGLLAYNRSDARSGSTLTWFDRSGQVAGTVGDPATYVAPTLAPDDRRLAVTMTTGTPANRDIWIIDIARAVPTRLTFDASDEYFPIWSPDGSRIAFAALTSIRQKSTSGNTPDEVLVKSPDAIGVMVPTDWSRDGRFIAYTKQVAPALPDVWILPLTGDRKPFPLATTQFAEDSAMFSPDTHWIAYTSGEAGVPQVFVQPFPPTGGKYQVSKNGGSQPSWRGDGKELFFVAPDSTMMSTEIDTSVHFAALPPKPLFRTQIAFGGRRQYTVTKDGKRFLAVIPKADTAALTVVVNWTATIEK